MVLRIVAGVMIVVGVAGVAGVFWLFSSGGGRTLQVALGFWATTGRTVWRRPHTGMVDAILARILAQSEGMAEPCCREFFPTYRPMDGATQGDLVAALGDVSEPISIAEAKSVAKALGVRVDLHNLAGEFVAAVEPSGAVLAPRKRDGGKPDDPSSSCSSMEVR